jgi:DMSO/TMAO reductase YedYZ heme-binding membrane subunit
MSVNPHLWWYVARAGGLVAWWSATLAVLLGLGLSGRAVRRRGAPAWLLGMHRYLGGLTVLFAGLHIGGLVADNYVHFGWREVLVPLASRWHPGAVAWGVVAFYTLLAVEATSLLMRRLPRKVWRAIHAWSFVVFSAGTIHAFTAGTDRGNVAVEWTAVVGATAFTFLALFRQLGRSSRSSGRARPTQPSGAAT